MSPMSQSLAFQMRVGYGFERKKKSKIGPEGGLIVALRNFTRNLCIMLNNFDLKIENQQNK